MTLVFVPNNGDLTAARYAAAAQHLHGDREQWVAATLELIGLARVLRSRYPDYASFSQWLDRNSLPQIKRGDFKALMAFAQLPGSEAVALLDQARGRSWEWIWRFSPQRAAERGAPAAKPWKHPPPLIGERPRLRGGIPDVMREAEGEEPAAPPPAPPPVRERKAPILRGLTRAEVDPDFTGDAVDFAAKYGPVSLHTKGELEAARKAETLTKWLRTMVELERAGRAMIAALRTVELDTLAKWTGRKGDRFEAWVFTAEEVAQTLRAINGKRAGPPAPHIEGSPDGHHS